MERVFFAYADQVAKQARKSRLPEHEVEAVVHDVFLKAFSLASREAWDGIRPFGAWLRTLTQNHLVDRHRKESKYEAMEPQKADDVVAEDRGPAETHDDHELFDVLQAFRFGLSKAEQALFQTRYEEGQSLVRSAEVLGWSEVRVRRMDTSLRARLFQRVKAAGYFQSVDVKIGGSLLGVGQKRRRKV